MPSLLNFARETTAGTGTVGTVTLTGAVSGYQTWLSAGAIDATAYRYGIEDGANFEAGVGVYGTAGTTVTRGTIMDSSAGYGTAISLSGTAEVYATLLQQDTTILQTGGILQVELYRSTLAADGNFDTDGVDLSGYDHLLINFTLKSSVSSTEDVVFLLFNNDSTATNYHYQSFVAYSSLVAAGVADGSVIGYVVPSDALANIFTIGQIFISQYASGISKIARASMSSRVDAAQHYERIVQFNWESTDAITRITIQPDGYSTDKFVAGSFCQIIGIKTVS